MNIIFEKQRKDAAPTKLQNDYYNKDRIGFWAIVSDVDSTLNRVNVISDLGISLSGIPVYSSEWVCADDSKDYVTGSRNLPPIGARVFVLMPTHTITGAFILCSGYAPGETKTQNLIADTNKKDKFNTLKEKITQGGWNLKEDYSSGNISLLSKDEKIKIELNVEENQQDKQKLGIVLTAYDHEILINDNEIKITSKKDVTLDASGSNVSLIASKFSVKPNKNSSMASLEVT